jgi:hypothetical protein
MIIHAISVHSGGGKVLLDQLLTESTFGKVHFLLCDDRYKLPEKFDNTIKVYRISPTLLKRWKSEFLLKNLSNENPSSSVLCFSNLPPAFKLKGNVILFLQNALLLPGIPFYTDSPYVYLRLAYEKMWLKFFWKNINEVWVQTSWMKKALKNCTIPISIKPFLPKLPAEQGEQVKKYDYVTISGTASHKRLLHLLKSWEMFLPSRIPSLLVITDGITTDMQACLNRLDNHVTVKININRDEIFKSYCESNCLIVTSKIESYCLPIYEAAHFKLKIFCADEAYARDSHLVDAFLDLSSPLKTKESLENNYQKFFSLPSSSKL